MSLANKNYSAEQVIALLDLTSLNETDTPEIIENLCLRAQTLKGNVAAVCIYPQFVALAKKLLSDTDIKICTVANFPHGNDDLANVLPAIKQSIEQGAQEIDVVIPYQTLLAGDNIVETFVRNCKEQCGSKITLKVILETGMLQSAEMISVASRAAILGGADFIKTSTGKVAVNATLAAFNLMLSAIKDSNRKVGIKPAGGIRTKQQACEYLSACEEVLGSEWLSPTYLRIGASSLLDELLENRT